MALEPTPSARSSFLKQERAYRAVRENIGRGRYGPGYRLVIDQLARELGLSAIPVREAVRRLEAEGLVSYVRHVGFQVVQLDDRSLIEAFETVAPLEAWAIATAAPRLAPDALPQLRAVAREQTEAVSNAEMIRYGRLERLFHESLLEPLPNAYARDMLQRMYDRMDTIRPQLYTWIPGRARQEIQEHFRLLEAIFERGPRPVLERIVREHRDRTRDAVMEASDREVREARDARDAATSGEETI
ncbi:MAG: GntR family transcriptional regulator [Clostridia bacterium]